jgi:hypothetical protein
MARGFLGERKGQQVVAVVTADRGPAEVIRYPCRLHPADELSQPAQVIRPEGLGRPRRERHPMQSHRIVFPDALEDVTGTAVSAHECSRLSPMSQPLSSSVTA